ncbi:MAG: hypothetical protein IKT43_04755 [Clostridia bacterium]|nr:hypothetical protein [Clostridia bacterium]
MADLSELASILKENPAFVKGALDAFLGGGAKAGAHAEQAEDISQKRKARALPSREALFSGIRPYLSTHTAEKLDVALMALRAVEGFSLAFEKGENRVPDTD